MRVCEACNKVIGDYDLFYIMSRVDWNIHKDQCIELHPYHFLISEKIDTHIAFGTG